MEKLEKEIEDLQSKYDTQKNLMDELWTQLTDAKEKLHAHKVESIGEDLKKMYEEKLFDMMEFINQRKAKPRTRFQSINWAFREMETAYKNDWYEVMTDPLDITIAEYDLLGLGSNFDIRIDIYQESVKMFVEDWMKTHMKEAQYDKNLFAFNN